MVHETSSSEDCEGGAWLARNATENIPIAIKNAAIGLIEPLSKFAMKTGKIGIFSVFNGQVSSGKFVDVSNFKNYWSFDWILFHRSMIQNFANSSNHIRSVPRSREMDTWR